MVLKVVTGFLDGNKRIAFTAADVFLRCNGFYIEVDAQAGHEFIYGSMDRGEFRFPKSLRKNSEISDWKP
jgi:prophage maintenance system killer protein